MPTHCSPSTPAPLEGGDPAWIRLSLRAAGLDDRVRFSILPDDGADTGALEYRVVWTDGPSVRDVIDALAVVEDPGPVRLQFDRRWSAELRAATAGAFERATGIVVLEQSGAPGGAVSPVWGLVSLGGRRAWEWWADYVDGWVSAADLPRPTIRDLRAWRRSPDPDVRREAVRRLADMERHPAP